MADRAAPGRRPESDRALAELAARRGLRVLAEDLLAEQSRIRALCCDANGDAVLLFQIDAGSDEAGLTRALAARSWVSARIDDWRKLAPDLPVRSGARVSALLLAERFAAETRSAVASLPDGWIDLAIQAPVERATVARAPVAQAPAPQASAPPEAARGPAEVATSTAPSDESPRRPQSRFRTGLRDEMLRPAPAASS